MIKIWGRDSSFNVRKLLWACAEMGVPYERIDAGMEYGIVDTSGFQALNPNRLIPALEGGDLANNGTVLWESNACLRYLARKYGLGGLCPSDAEMCADADRWMDWQLSRLWPVMLDGFLQYARTPIEQRDQSRIDASYQATCKCLAILDAALASKGTGYIAGAELTMGDIALGCAAQRWYVLPWSRQPFEAVDNWMDGLRKRAAFREHVDHPI